MSNSGAFALCSSLFVEPKRPRNFELAWAPRNYGVWDRKPPGYLCRGGLYQIVLAAAELHRLPRQRARPEGLAEELRQLEPPVDL